MKIPNQCGVLTVEPPRCYNVNGDALRSYNFHLAWCGKIWRSTARLIPADGEVSKFLHGQVERAKGTEVTVVCKEGANEPRGFRLPNGEMVEL